MPTRTNAVVAMGPARRWHPPRILMDMTRMARAGRLLAAGLLIALLLLSSCGPQHSGTSQGASGSTTADDPQTVGKPSNQSNPGTKKTSVFPVAVTRATRGAISDYISVSGGIEPAQQVDVYADIGGQLVKLNVRLGQFVRKDQVVAEVDPSRPGQNYVPSPVRAPIAGTITLLPVDLGSRVAQGVPIVQISTIGNLEIRTQIAERYIGVVKVGERARIELDPYPHVGFSAHVVELSPVVDPQTRTMDVTLKLDTPDDRVKAGMFAEIKIVTIRKSGIIKVPVEAVVVRGESRFVFVERGDATVVRRDVTTGVNVDGQVEVVSGVEAGERVVVRGQTLLEDSSKTKVIEELPPLPDTDTIL